MFTIDYSAQISLPTNGFCLLTWGPGQCWWSVQRGPGVLPDHSQMPCASSSPPVNHITNQPTTHCNMSQPTTHCISDTTSPQQQILQPDQFQIPSLCFFITASQSTTHNCYTWHLCGHLLNNWGYSLHLSMGPQMSLKTAPPRRGKQAPHLTHGSVGPTGPHPQTASWLVQPFWHRSHALRNWQRIFLFGAMTHCLGDRKGICYVTRRAAIQKRT